MTLPRMLTGIIPATPTPMKEDGSTDPGRAKAVIGHLVESGVDGVFVCGTTGEFASLTLKEHIEMAEAFRAATPKHIAFIVHIGRSSVAEACEVARAAKRMGADAVGALPPYYFKVNDAKTLTAVCEPMAQAAGGLPFYYYHIPSLTGANVAMRDFLETALPRIPNLAGVKYTHENLMDVLACINDFGDRAQTLFGRDEMFLGGLATGSVAAVGSTFNYMAPVYKRITEAFERGDMETARRWQARSVEVIRLFGRYGGAAVTKAFMKFVGVDCGPNRLPLMRHTATELENFRREVEATGFFAWRSGVEPDVPSACARTA